VLSRIIKKGSVLEIGSGSGEHGVFFQKRFPGIIWQTSDPELVHRKSISSWIDYEDLTKKMPQPLEIDVEKIPWKIPLRLAHSLQGIVSINMIHVAHWSCTIALFRESGKLLKKGQFLMLYGPFKICNKHTSQSNYYLHLSTGELLRKEIEMNTALGIQVKDIMNRGELVSDELVLKIVR